MDTYRMQGAKNISDGDELIYATHPAFEGSYIVYANKDGTTHRTAVILWGVLDNGMAVPITLSGVWDGVSNKNNFVLHSDGSCSKFEESWPTIEDAIEAVQRYGE